MGDISPTRTCSYQVLSFLYPTGFPAQQARHPGSIDCSSDSAVESRVEPERQDLLDIQDMPSFSAPCCLASLSALG